MEAELATGAPMMQATLALVAGMSGLAAWWLSGDWRWIVGAVLILAPWPYTLIVIKPTNDGLHAIRSKRRTPPRAGWCKNGEGCMPGARRSGSQPSRLFCGRSIEPGTQLVSLTLATFSEESRLSVRSWSMRSRSFLNASRSSPLRTLPFGRRTRIGSTLVPLTISS